MGVDIHIAKDQASWSRAISADPLKESGLAMVKDWQGGSALARGYGANSEVIRGLPDRPTSEIRQVVKMYNNGYIRLEDDESLRDCTYIASISWDDDIDWVGNYPIDPIYYPRDMRVYINNNMYLAVINRITKDIYPCNPRNPRVSLDSCPILSYSNRVVEGSILVPQCVIHISEDSPLYPIKVGDSMVIHRQWSDAHSSDYEIDEEINWASFKVGWAIEKKLESGMIQVDITADPDSFSEGRYNSQTTGLHISRASNFTGNGEFAGDVMVHVPPIYFGAINSGSKHTVYLSYKKSVHTPRQIGDFYVSACPASVSHRDDEELPSYIEEILNSNVHSGIDYVVHCIGSSSKPIEGTLGLTTDSGDPYSILDLVSLLNNQNTADNKILNPINLHQYCALLWLYVLDAGYLDRDTDIAEPVQSPYKQHDYITSGIYHPAAHLGITSWTYFNLPIHTLSTFPESEIINGGRLWRCFIDLFRGLPLLLSSGIVRVPVTIDGETQDFVDPINQVTHEGDLQLLWNYDFVRRIKCPKGAGNFRVTKMTISDDGLIIPTEYIKNPIPEVPVSTICFESLKELDSLESSNYYTCMNPVTQQDWFMSLYHIGVLGDDSKLKSESKETLINPFIFFTYLG